MKSNLISKNDSNREKHVTQLNDGRILRKGDDVWLFNGKGKERLSAGIYPSALVQPVDGRDLDIRISYPHVKGDRDHMDLPRSMLATPAQVKQRLLDGGLRLPPKKQDFRRAVEILEHQTPTNVIKTFSAGGWRSTGGSGDDVFVWGGAVKGEPARPNERFESMVSDTTTFVRSGSLKKWKQKLGHRCRGNAYLTFAVASALAAPLLRIAGIESDGVHFHGPSSSGKTTLLAVVSSVFGDPAQYQTTWHMTENAIEALAARYNDLPFVLDEIGAGESKNFGRGLYRAINGTGKNRANIAGGAQHTKRFRNKMFSTGEIGIAEHMAQAGDHVMDGQDIRLLCLKTDFEFGAFETIHNAESAAIFADRLTRNVHEHYGVVGDEYLTFITRNLKKIRRWLGKRLPVYRRRILESASSYVLTDAEARVARRLALVIFAGELATGQSLTGWKKGDAEVAVKRCFCRWLDHRKKVAEASADGVARKLKGFVAANRKRFVHLVQAAETDHNAVLGYRHRLEGERVYLLPVRRFKRIYKGGDYREAAKALRQVGMLQRSKRMTRQMRVPGMSEKPVFYVVRRDSLS